MGQGEFYELQIPRFARDDNKSLATLLERGGAEGLGGAGQLYFFIEEAIEFRSEIDEPFRIVFGLHLLDESADLRLKWHTEQRTLAGK